MPGILQPSEVAARGAVCRAWALHRKKRHGGAETQQCSSQKAPEREGGEGRVQERRVEGGREGGREGGFREMFVDGFCDKRLGHSLWVHLLQ